jgi:hypothetical protein
MEDDMNNKMMALATVLALFSGAALAQGGATAGSAGTAAGNGLSASTAGVGATSGDSAALAMGGSAAGGRTQSRSGVHGNQNLNGQAMAQAHEGGDFAKSHTVCHDKTGSSVECRTKTMEHEPGQKPQMSTTTGSASLPN